ncbi:hypothetical protein [Gryllotalpicola protaetiae]|uniref:Uncharacterized protein n=1 Tax=Gryllotalpicola protaetiae TaxID=2419771 RepID=A0A387BL79_9MICO|nr:hypothetical protein [Gryllotalpicola protaetiae]AYG03418.1 hypothetical protein D7I44_07635 [Gryllotalpicola protaetiae]
MSGFYAAGRLNLGLALPGSSGRLPAEQHRLISDAEVKTIASWLGLDWERLSTDGLNLPGQMVTLHPTFYRLSLDGRDVVIEHDALMHPGELLPAALQLHLDDADLDGSLRSLLATQPVDVHDLDGEDGERELWLALDGHSRLRYAVPVTDARGTADALASAFTWLVEQQLMDVRPRLGRKARAFTINAGLGVIYVAANKGGEVVCEGWRGVSPGGLVREISRVHEEAMRKLAPAGVL